RLRELVEKILSEERPTSVAEFSKLITADIDDFTGFVKAHDDITFIVSRCTSKVPGQPPLSADENQPVDIRNVSDHPSQQ
ncbi:MAG TPA: hypothetical protein VJ983_06395, partial [candidate division Zixibacteria bacterium]|nr:hypothetical protein [candidate division Zixibacteria bacterium]